LQYVAGHDNIKTTRRYVHPQANAVQALFLRLGGLESRRQAHRGTKRTVVTKMNTLESALNNGSGQQIEKKQFFSAEVVKLADTPS
jgi:hypothetical protein